jgi:hypothetical protein
LSTAVTVTIGSMLGSFSTSTISIPITSGVVWILFFITAGIVILSSGIFIFHWKYYGMEGNKKLIVKTIYVVGTISLLTVAFIAASIF